MQHIMNNISRMSNIRNREGLNVVKGSNATSQYIRMRIIQKEIKSIFNSAKEEFEQTYKHYKGYDFVYVNSFIETFCTLSTGKQEKTFQQIEKEGIETFLLNKMGMYRDRLTLRETAPKVENLNNYF